jgi:hypothetical protein
MSARWPVSWQAFEISSLHEQAWLGEYQDGRHAVVVGLSTIFSSTSREAALAVINELRSRRFDDGR